MRKEASLASCPSEEARGEPLAARGGGVSERSGAGGGACGPRERSWAGPVRLRLMPPSVEGAGDYGEGEAPRQGAICQRGGRDPPGALLPHRGSRLLLGHLILGPWAPA
ncbi:hypothetical protein AAFF_G00222640 [Aldrovandia affinis]|uniref:Uncharacterized protein n=1 Tax=Aldrovandia affinis TaxID=143900 RepID=A0AAD7RFC0_9TELE|nr:hypothetical protein AAFF_G00222640 [Aldrovandia affinis]